MNVDRAKAIHFRNTRRSRNDYALKYEHQHVEYVSTYEYLDITLNKHLNFNMTTYVLTVAGGMALGAVISTILNSINVGYITLTKLFEASVSPVIGFASKMWGYKSYMCNANEYNCEQSATISACTQKLLFWDSTAIWAGLAQVKQHCKMARLRKILTATAPDTLTK